MYGSDPNISCFIFSIVTAASRCEWTQIK